MRMWHWAVAPLLHLVEMATESREFAQVVAQLSGKYYEGASRATVFTAMSVTGRDPQSNFGRSGIREKRR